MDGSRTDNALEMFKGGYNCSQSVLLAFVDEKTVDVDMAMAISAPFGHGYSRHKSGPCGALSGALMVIGIKMKAQSSDQKEIYRKSREFLEKMERDYDTIVCRELLKEKFGQNKSCIDMVKDSCEILEEFFPEN